MSGTESKRPTLEIRLATMEDAAAISQVLLQSFMEYKSDYTPEGFAATTPSVEQIKNRLTEGPAWVGLLDGNVVATVSAVPQEDSLYLRGMGVLPAARGNQTGKLLLDRVQEFAYARKCERLFLSTTPFLSRAISLYERLGFIRTDEGPHDLYGTPLFTMERRLSQPAEQVTA